METQETRPKVTSANVNDDLLRQYYDGVSVAEVAKKSGRSVSAIRLIIKSDKLLNGEPDTPRSRPKDNRCFDNKRPLSNHHAKIGLLIQNHRTSMELNCTEYGALISCSRYRVRDIELGSYDITLREIQNLERVLGINLVTEPSIKREEA